MHKCCLPLMLSFCTSQCILQTWATANYYRGGESELQRSYLSKSLLRTSIIQAKSRIHKSLCIMHEVLITHRKAGELCSKPHMPQLSLELALLISQAWGTLVCLCGQVGWKVCTFPLLLPSPWLWLPQALLVRSCWDSCCSKWIDFFPHCLECG